MFTLERRNQILSYLKENKSASISCLSKMFFIGELAGRYVSDGDIIMDSSTTMILL